MSEFGIDIKIAPKGDGLQKVEQSLAAVEKKAGEVGKKVGEALGAGAESAAGRVSGAAREETTALGGLNAEVKRGIDLWNQLTMAEQREAAEAKTAAQAKADLAARIKSYDQAMKDTLATQTKARESAMSLADGWKEITRSIGDVGNAVNAVKHGLDLIKLGFDTSKEAARAAIAVWRSMDNSGPSAYVGHDNSVSRRLRMVNDTFAAMGESYANLDALPAELRKAANNTTTLDDAAFQAMLDKRVNDYKARMDAADKALEKLKAENKAKYGNSVTAYVHDALAEEEKEIEGVLEKQVAARARLVERGGKITRQMVNDEAALDRRISEHNAKIASDPTLMPISRDEVAGRRGRRLAYARDNADDASGGYTSLDYIGDSAKDATASVKELWTSIREVRKEMSDRFSDGKADNGFLLQSAAGQMGIGAGNIGFAPIEKKHVDWAKEYAQALSGPVGSAVDGLIEGLTRWEMSWKDWGRTALDQISQVIIKLLLMQAIEGAFSHGWIGGKTANILSGVLGGGPITGGGSGGNARRVAPGDPFGGAGAGSAPIITERVMMPSRGAAGEGAAPVFSTKVVVVSNAHEAAREVLNSKEGERAIVTHVHNNRGKLGR